MLIDWKNRTSWENVITSACKKILGSKYENIIKNNAEKIIYCDYDKDVCNLFADKKEQADILNSLVKELKNSITYIQAYHACRPQNIESYYKNGLIPLNPIDIQKLFGEIFCNKERKFSRMDIKTAISKVSTDTRDNVNYLALDDRFLINHCGHYLIYGSEYLNSLTINLPNANEDTRDILKKLGKATIFVFKISSSHIIEWNCFASDMLAEHAYHLAHGTTEVGYLNHAVTFNERISSQTICSHYHPKQIKDPFKARRIWNDKIKKYV